MTVTSTDVPVSMWCWPGPRAAAGVQSGPAGELLLAVFLDPVNLLLTVPPFPQGAPVMAVFLRQLARAAARMATELDLTQSPQAGGAHRALPDGSDETGTVR
jgi:hypothetical protein